MIFRACPVTPYAGNAYNARNVNTDGSLNNNNAYNARNVNTDGSLNNNNAYNGNNGVRPDLVENATE